MCWKLLEDTNAQPGLGATGLEKKKTQCYLKRTCLSQHKLRLAQIASISSTGIQSLCRETPEVQSVDHNPRSQRPRMSCVLSLSLWGFPHFPKDLTYRRKPQTQAEDDYISTDYILTLGLQVCRMSPLHRWMAFLCPPTHYYIFWPDHIPVSECSLENLYEQ